MSNNQNGKLGLLDSSTILIGGMIGSAIFSLSGMTILNAGPASILSWIIAAVILFAYGLQTAELSSIYPRSGGIFVFPAKSLGKNERQGRIWGWISAWAYLFGCWAGAAFSAIYVSIYLGVGFPALGKYQIPLAIAAVVVCGLLNLVNISITGKANTILTIGLAATMLIFIVIALFSGKWDAGMLSPFFTQGVEGTWGFMSAIPIAMVAYGSIVAVAFMVGEIKDPNKTVPKAMTIAMVVVVTLYILVILSVLGLISSQFLQKNPGMAYIPLYAAAFTKLQAIPWLAKLISISAVLALITTILVVMTLSARALQASAESGILPKFLAKNNEKTGVPVNAQIIVILIVGIISAFPSFTNLIVNLGSLCNAVVVAIVCLTVVAARKKNPSAQGFKAPGGNILPVITLIVIIAAYIPGILSGGWKLWAWTAGYFLIGMIIYFISTRKLDS
ncbi:APC family permease [Clostridium swellfunianum]|uniref:APC family permease n=1 Tax=Clostridium swellfunianum TaxID=1367462 RepID=UPI00202E8875|nr:APC family permease [Clostridium swellfunianum]MCM0648106.1 APC family permease [Clostridium swellfunianum]